MQAVPAAMLGRDIIGIAKTGGLHIKLSIYLSSLMTFVCITNE
jgi:hypothetical protein